MKYLDSEKMAGPIPAIIADVVAAVQRNTRLGGVMAGAKRVDVPDYPPAAVREAVCNALMHRDYSKLARGAQVQVNLYSNQLEFLSPGGLYDTVTAATVATAGYSSTRNQYLADILESTPYEGGFVAENRGTGFKLMKFELERNRTKEPFRYCLHNSDVMQRAIGNAKGVYSLTRRAESTRSMAASFEPLIEWSKAFAQPRRVRPVAIENDVRSEYDTVRSREEDRLTLERAPKVLKDAHWRSDNGKFSNLSLIHRSLFEDIYDGAGSPRTIDIAKDDSGIVSAANLPAALHAIDEIWGSDFDTIVQKFVKMYAAHPFLRGNGRSTRIWLDAMLWDKLERVVDWSRIDKHAYLSAMERSTVCDEDIKDLLVSALVRTKLESPEEWRFVRKSIAASWDYERPDVPAPVSPRTFAVLFDDGSAVLY